MLQRLSPLVLDLKLIALLLATLLAQGGCHDAPPLTTEGADGELRYELRWNREGLTALEGGGWAWTNDLGHRFTLTRGYMVSYSSELVECLPTTANRPPASDPRPLDLDGDGIQLAATAITSWLESALAPSVAWAGHSDDVVNPAAVTTPWVEALHVLEDRTFGVTRPGPLRYCQVHYLVGRANGEARQMPQEVDMARVSLYLEGTAQAPDAQAPTPFTVRTALAAAVLFEIYPEGAFGDDDAQRKVDTARHSADILIERHFTALFDGADPTSMSERTLERHILRNLIDTTQVTVRAPL